MWTLCHGNSGRMTTYIFRREVSGFVYERHSGCGAERDACRWTGRRPGIASMRVVRPAKAEAGAGTGEAEQQKDRQQDRATERDISACEPGRGSAGLIRRRGRGAQGRTAVGAKSCIIRVRQSTVRAGDHDVTVPDRRTEFSAVYPTCRCKTSRRCGSRYRPRW